MLPRHATDVVSLVSGTVFAGFTAVWLLTVTDVIDLDQAWLAGPAILILAGVVGLAAALRPSRRDDARPPLHQPAEDATVVLAGNHDDREDADGRDGAT